jgi:integrase
MALAAGVHPKVVQKRLGHTSIMLTLQTYSHTIQAMEAAAAEQVAPSAESAAAVIEAPGLDS